jgi:hypothetical protein
MHMEFCALQCVGAYDKKNSIFGFLFASGGWNVLVGHKEGIYQKQLKKQASLVHIVDIF